MCTTGDNGVIIILSDDEEDEEHDVSCSDASVFIVETEDIKKNDVALSQTALDEDLVVTFSRRAEVLPHARYDCAIHPFTATDCEVGSPVASNQLICDQCFCYICDKLASVCVLWVQSGVCHCNSHKRSDFWNSQRSTGLLGGLKPFNLTLSEIDAHLRHAETLLQRFKQELAARFATFQKGMTFQEYGLNLPNQPGFIFDYTQVYEFVSSFLNQTDNQNGRAAAILRLGAAEQFIRHYQSSGGYISPSSMANANQAKVVLLQRVVASVQRQMVMDDFTSDFLQKLQEFYKNISLPAELRSMKNSLCVRPWDDVLLVSVLKGQNVSGVRKDKGKKDVLFEQSPVVQLRTELLQRQHRYRELCRYLRVVQTDDSKLLQPLHDLMPYFMCMDGDFMSACHSLVPSVNPPAASFTPLIFLFYLRIFETAMAPKRAVGHMTELCHPDVTWEPIKGAVALKRAELVKFALRVQRCCSAVYADSQCWHRLLTLVNSPCGSVTALQAPNAQFLHEAKDVVNSILLKPPGSNIQIPRFFQEVYPDQALLLLVTGALGLRILSAALTPALPVLNTFQENQWALWWLWESLSSNVERLNSFLQEITQEVDNATGGDSSFSFLRAIILTLSSSARNWDQQPSSS
ncbi:uncharacterized protein zgc:112980 [Platichthys flesus]|uniref:uncharacterized protein zgc:112980 n=1 Tax=Platichthys flesus TaxID=8260 RepID=UPI002DB78D62|nr:uncharacterized protein zgc:112980 [Platichthys flesus]